MIKNRVCSKRLRVLVYCLCFIVSLPHGFLLADGPISVDRTEDGKYIPTVAYDPAKQETEKPVLTNVPELADPSGCLTPVEKPSAIENQAILTAAEKQSVETLYTNLEEKRVAYLSVEQIILIRAVEAADVNNDGTINAKDLFMLEERLMRDETSSATMQDYARMDIDGDGILTLRDLDLIHRAIDSQEKYVTDTNGDFTIDGQDWNILERQKQIAEQEKRRKEEIEKAFWEIGEKPEDLNRDAKLDEYDLREARERKLAEDEARARGTEMEQPAGAEEPFLVKAVFPVSPLSPGYPAQTADNYISPFDDLHSDDPELMPVSYTKTPVNAGMGGGKSILTNWLNQLSSQENDFLGNQQYVLAAGLRNDAPTLWQLLEIFINQLQQLLSKKDAGNGYKHDAGLLGSLQANQRIAFSSNALELTYGYINEFNGYSKRRENANSNVVVLSPSLLALWAVLNEPNQEHPFQRVLDLWRVGPEGVKALYAAQARIDDLNRRVKARKGFIRYNSERRVFNTSCISFLLAQVGVYEYVDYAGGGKIG